MTEYVIVITDPDTGVRHLGSTYLFKSIEVTSSYAEAVEEGRPWEIMELKELGDI